MSPQSASNDATTYLPESGRVGRVGGLGGGSSCSGVEVAEARPALIDAEGVRTALPGVVFEALRHVVTAMANGQGVTVAPHDAQLTTQEEADFLGVSRPTLVRLLEDNEIAYEMRGRHRRVRLIDILEYQQRSRQVRRESLARMARMAEDAGLYEVTSGAPIRTR